MGYSYGRNRDTGRMQLACDSCGGLGSVRKRTCPATVTCEVGFTLPYCPAPALCPACYKAKRATLHAACFERAAISQAEYDAKRARLDAGEHILRAAWGDWHERVPSGYVLAVFEGRRPEPGHRGEETYLLIPTTDYETPGGYAVRGKFASDFTTGTVTDVRP